jgi:hypothetical protein
LSRAVAVFRRDKTRVGGEDIRVSAFFRLTTQDVRAVRRVTHIS